MQSQLVRTRGFINGNWVDALSGAEFAVSNPANGETIAMVANMGREDALAAVASAHAALTHSRKSTAT